MPAPWDSPAAKTPEIIAAVATAPGRAGIGVVRLSGPDLKPIVLQLAKKVPAPRVATVCRFRDAGGAVIDEGIALYFPTPHSYTGEDVLELQGHGGSVVLELLLCRCLELGARLAAPGEFTRRAFLNDKLDLTQAEAVADLIEASTAAAARSAVRSLTGDFSRTIRDLDEQLLELRMRVEAAIDFPEEEVDALRPDEWRARVQQLRAKVDEVRARARQGSLLRSGLHVVLAGKPNVGKSSLLNQLAGEERAIVTAVAGTTRDAVRETINVQGIPLHIIDTAGLRTTGDEVERIGIARTWQEIERADVVVLLLDARDGLVAADEAILARLPASIARIDVFNKCDLVGRGARRVEEGGKVRLWLSAKTGEGIEGLKDELLHIAGWQAGTEGVFIARERHLMALAHVARQLDSAVEAGARVDLVAEDLRLASVALGEVTGTISSDDLLGEIFARFCIGK